MAGSCFCCNFNALTSTVERLGEGQLPDVILAEPVGSCTDLVATVIRPLTEVYGVNSAVHNYPLNTGTTYPWQAVGSRDGGEVVGEF